ncbi:Os03g0778300 [Oryza sativa Japonica Group]|uniref:Cathepsin propeptide inhibitor domain-containing protein n=2 Tax=Oryza sativa subsp. japonica TaxID=39947 RepID=A0A8J8XV54_ORYSJ|nr:hypothetical protein [Oryza sativa Japonica Group]ABF99158.1 hypothetical protein LOC_Os03g56690 [Oryza sativa Japonica Group]EAZ28774.1 hypothetical protein OsJ_12794 [Oryza sativa Japonica Group]BAS86652.1 Os03g0778300 [Oryza sativa Japonica Group]
MVAGVAAIRRKILAFLSHQSSQAIRIIRDFRDLMGLRGVCSIQDDPEPGKDISGKDLESDEAIWALYERWCEAYEKERDHAEMTRWFEMFKNNAEYIYSLNSEITSEAEQLILGPYCDGFNEKDKAEFLNDFGHFNGVHEFVE